MIDNFSEDAGEVRRGSRDDPNADASVFPVELTR